MVIKVLSGPLSGEVFKWKKSDFPIKIGRERNNDIVFLDSLISKYHAEIVYSKDSFLIRDIKSKNGILINCVEVIEAYLTKDCTVCMVILAI